MARFDLRRRLTAEFLGTGTLVCAVVGSGIMGERLAGGNTALALLGNTLPTGAILTVLILILGPISGAHMNPAVSLAMARRRELPAGEAVAYAVAQMAGGIAGASTAHLMFDLPMIQLGSTVRTGLGQWIGEFVATFGLLATILGCLRFARAAITPAVGLYITAAYWFTSSTSFANPAVALARAFVVEPDLLLLDEPYTGLDQDAAAVLDDLLRQVATEGRTVIMTTHDLRRGHALADRIAILSRGQIAFDAPCREIDPDALPALYADVTGAVTTR